jgi:hypothetical protein
MYGQDNRDAHCFQPGVIAWKPLLQLLCSFVSRPSTLNEHERELAFRRPFSGGTVANLPQWQIWSHWDVSTLLKPSCLCSQIPSPSSRFRSYRNPLKCDTNQNDVPGKVVFGDWLCARQYEGVHGPTHVHSDHVRDQLDGFLFVFN